MFFNHTKPSEWWIWRQPDSGTATVRFVTHLDFTEEMLGRVVEVIGKISF